MLIITVAWGSCFVAIDWGLRDAPVLWFAAFRSLLAGTVLVGVALTQRRPLPHGLTAWSQIGVLALFNVTIAFAAMFAAAAALSAGVAAVLSNAQPLLILLPAYWLFGERPSPFCRSRRGCRVHRLGHHRFQVYRDHEWSRARIAGRSGYHHRDIARTPNA